MDTPLTARRCVPCEGGTRPLGKDKAAELHTQLPSGWALGKTALTKTFSFPTFIDAIGFVDRVATLAEAEGHHPDIDIRYRKVTLTLTTHAIKGLSDNDFILAAKIEAVSSAGNGS
ncbi:4a-hydroxytetrahydrobiopterin dehydratase [Candidatus Berkelbacteria bacterium]|nr:4a-hydroxytetrahydrobiopterin dehydratase [Candidatus Berkelbacteria bacterium]